MNDMTRTCFLNTTGSGTRNPPLAIFTCWGDNGLALFEKMLQIILPDCAILSRPTCG